MFPVNNTDNARYVIFASDLPEEDTRRILVERRIPFKVLQGRYKGQNETSYLVPLDDSSGMINELVAKQESVLQLSPVLRSGVRKAALMMNDGNDEHEMILLGDFVPVSKEEAESQDNFTYDPTQNLYFVTKK